MYTKKSTPMDSFDVELKTSVKSSSTDVSVKNESSTDTPSSQPAKLNVQATSNYISVVSRHKGLLGESHARTFNQLNSNLNSYVQDQSSIKNVEVDTDSAQMGHYRKLTVKVINRDPSLQEKVAQDLSSSKQLVRSRDAASALETSMQKLPPALNEGCAAGKNLSKFICQSVVNLTDYENMGAGLQRDLAIRDVFPTQNPLSPRSKIATNDALSASIAYVKSNQPEVLATLKEEQVVAKPKPGSTTPQIMTRYLRQALNEFPEDSTYLDIFKQNKDKTEQASEEEYTDDVSKDTAKRIHSLIQKAADTARRSNLLQPNATQNASQSAQASSVASSASQNAQTEDASNLSLSELSARAAKLQQQFREERIKLANEGKLPDPAPRIRNEAPVTNQQIANVDAAIEQNMAKEQPVQNAQPAQNTALSADDIKKLALEVVKEVLKESTKAQLEASQNTAKEVATKAVSELQETVKSQLEISQNSAKEAASQIVKEALKESVKSQLEISQNSAKEVASQIVKEALKESVKAQIEASQNSAKEVVAKVANELQESVKSQLELTQNSAKEVAAKVANELKETVKASIEQNQTTTKQIASQSVKEALESTVKEQIQATTLSAKEAVKEAVKETVKAQIEATKEAEPKQTSNLSQNVLDGAKIKYSFSSTATSMYGNISSLNAVPTPTAPEFSKLSLPDESLVKDMATKQTQDKVQAQIDNLQEPVQETVETNDTVDEQTKLQANTQTQTNTKALETTLASTDTTKAASIATNTQDVDDIPEESKESVASDETVSDTDTDSDETKKVIADDKRAQETAVKEQAVKTSTENTKASDVKTPVVDETVAKQIVENEAPVLDDTQDTIDDNAENTKASILAKDIALKEQALKQATVNETKIPVEQTEIESEIAPETVADDVTDDVSDDDVEQQKAANLVKTTEQSSKQVSSSTSKETAPVQNETVVDDTVTTDDADSDTDESTQNKTATAQNSEILDIDPFGEEVIEETTVVNPFTAKFNVAAGVGTNTTQNTTQAPVTTPTSSGVTLEEKAAQFSQNELAKAADATTDETTDSDTNPSASASKDASKNSILAGLTSTADEHHVQTGSLNETVLKGTDGTTTTNLGTKILKDTVPSTELEESAVPSDVKAPEKDISKLTQSDEDEVDFDIQSIPSKTPGAAAITSGQNEPIPDHSVVDNVADIKEKSGFFSKIASIFGKKETAQPHKLEDTPNLQAAASVSNFMALNSKDSPLDNLMYSLKVQINNQAMPQIVRDQAKEFLDKLENPINDLPSVSNWLNFTAGPMSPSSPQALALHQWAFMLLSIRFSQLGKSVDKFLKKNIDLMEDKFDEELKTLTKNLGDGSRGTISSLIDDTFEQVNRYQNPSKENLPLLYQFIPLPPAYDGGREGGFNARPVIEEDGKTSWHMNFVFDLQNLGPIEIKAVAKLPELKLSVVASTFDGLQKVQECLPYLKGQLQDLGITTRSATARLGKVHLQESVDTPVINQHANDGSTFSVDI